MGELSLNQEKNGGVPLSQGQDDELAHFLARPLPSLLMSAPVLYNGYFSTHVLTHRSIGVRSGWNKPFLLVSFPHGSGCPVLRALLVGLLIRCPGIRKKQSKPSKTKWSPIFKEPRFGWVTLAAALQ